MRPLGPFDAERRVVVAVSGGADSMALALLLSRWGQPIAVVVDHGLRAEAAAEAAVTTARLAELGIPSSTVRALLAAGAAQAERARAARYDLLLAACRAAGVPDLLIAHHAGDQAETVQMRSAAGSGVLGLAAMAALSYRSEARVLRPLLGTDPARLRATLLHAGIQWVEDPGNADRRTVRGSLRATMTVADRAAALALADSSAAESDQIRRAVADAMAGVRLAPEGFAVVPGHLNQYALSALLWSISGRRYPPPRAHLARGLTTRTVHGVQLQPAGRLGPGTLVTREPGAVQGRIPAYDGAVWDGRFRVRGPMPAGLSVGALGGDAASCRHRSPLPAVVLATLPALRDGDAVVAVPHLSFPDTAACRSVVSDFWPQRPTAPVSGVSRR